MSKIGGDYDAAMYKEFSGDLISVEEITAEPDIGSDVATLGRSLRLAYFGEVAGSQSAQSTATLLAMLALLRAQHWLYWTNHWQARGAAFYADHLMFAKAYESLEDEVDVLAEKIVGLLGWESVDVASQMAMTQRWIGRWTDSREGDATLQLIQSEIDAQVYLRRALESLKEGPLLTLGLEDFIQSTASAHETNLYLLQQRNGGHHVKIAKKPKKIPKKGPTGAGPAVQKVWEGDPKHGAMMVEGKKVKGKKGRPAMLKNTKGPDGKRSSKANTDWLNFSKKWKKLPTEKKIERLTRAKRESGNTKTKKMIQAEIDRMDDSEGGGGSQESLEMKLSEAITKVSPDVRQSLKDEFIKTYKDFSKSNPNPTSEEVAKFQKKTVSSLIKKAESHLNEEEESVEDADGKQKLQEMHDRVSKIFSGSKTPESKAIAEGLGGLDEEKIKSVEEEIGDLLQEQEESIAEETRKYEKKWSDIEKKALAGDKKAKLKIAAKGVVSEGGGNPEDLDDILRSVGAMPKKTKGSPGSKKTKGKAKKKKETKAPKPKRTRKAPKPEDDSAKDGDEETLPPLDPEGEISTPVSRKKPKKKQKGKPSGGRGKDKGKRRPRKKKKPQRDAPEEVPFKKKPQRDAPEEVPFKKKKKPQRDAPEEVPFKKKKKPQRDAPEEVPFKKKKPGEEEPSEEEPTKTPEGSPDEAQPEKEEPAVDQPATEPERPSLKPPNSIAQAWTRGRFLGALKHVMGMPSRAKKQFEAAIQSGGDRLAESLGGKEYLSKRKQNRKEKELNKEESILKRKQNRKVKELKKEVDKYHKAMTGEINKTFQTHRQQAHKEMETYLKNIGFSGLASGEKKTEIREKAFTQFMDIARKGAIEELEKAGLVDKDGNYVGAKIKVASLGVRYTLDTPGRVFIAAKESPETTLLREYHKNYLSNLTNPSELVLTETRDALEGKGHGKRASQNLRLAWFKGAGAEGYFFDSPNKREVRQLARSHAKSNVTPEGIEQGAPPSPSDIKDMPGGKTFSTLHRYVVNTSEESQDAKSSEGLRLKYFKGKLS